MVRAVIEKKRDHHVHEILVVENAQLPKQNREVRIQLCYGDEGELHVEESDWQLLHSVDRSLHL